MRSRDKSGRLFYPILQTAGFAGFFCRRSQSAAICLKTSFADHFGG
jgi:hypothetical protein